MNRVMLLIACFSLAIECCAGKIDYSNCQSIEDVIARETQEIGDTHPTNHDELAQLYVSRGESYLLNAQYEKAVEDFQAANSSLGNSHTMDTAMVVAFRVAFGEVVSYDNLGMPEHTQQALQQLQTVVGHIGCDDCIEHRPCQEIVRPSINRAGFWDIVRPAVNTVHFRDMLVFCRQTQQQENDNETVEPDGSPPGWCEEAVVGTGRAMDAIACLAPNYAVKIALIGVIEALITRGVKCCQAGGFWKTCATPIWEKWREWKHNKERRIFPNSRNLPLFIDE